MNLRPLPDFLDQHLHRLRLGPADRRTGNDNGMREIKLGGACRELGERGERRESDCLNCHSHDGGTLFFSRVQVK